MTAKSKIFPTDLVKKLAFMLAPLEQIIYFGRLKKSFGEYKPKELLTNWPLKKKTTTIYLLCPKNMREEIVIH